MVSLRKAMDIARCARQDPLYGGIVFDCKPHEAFETIKVLHDEVEAALDDFRTVRQESERLATANSELRSEVSALKQEVERLRAAGDALAEALDYELGCPCNDENPYDEMYGCSMLALQTWRKVRDDT